VLVANGYTVPTVIFSGHLNFIYYASGIISTCPLSNTVDHAVLIVGFEYDGTTRGNILKVKNSWSNFWGEGGYFRILMAGNLCNLCAYSTYAFA
jgi:C1A family cysteine protease